MTSQKQIEQVLLKRGFVTPDQLVKARAAQSKNHADIGHILVGMDLLTRDELRQVIQIARQQAVFLHHMSCNGDNPDVDATFG